jgi:hypothetical protein
LVVQQAQAQTEQVVKVGLKLFQELGERTRELGERAKKLAVEVSLYREMAVQLAAREGVDVPDFVKDESAGLGEEQAGQLREWLGQLSSRRSAAGEETVAATTTRKKRTAVTECREWSKRSRTSPTQSPQTRKGNARGDVLARIVRCGQNE